MVAWQPMLDYLRRRGVVPEPHHLQGFVRIKPVWGGRLTGESRADRLILEHATGARSFPEEDHDAVLLRLSESGFGLEEDVR